METRANYALVGAFTILVIAAAFGFVYWFSGQDARAKSVPYRVVFSGSVSGLSKGSLVLYSGIRIGEVVNLEIDRDDPGRVNGLIQVDPSAPINSDTRARLEFQGLTGVASIQLSGGSKTSKPLVAADKGQPPVIYADRSEFQNLLESAQTIARRFDEVLGKVDTLLSANGDTITGTLKNVETFSKALADHSDEIAGILKNANDLTRKLSDAADKLDNVLAGAQDVIGSGDAKGAINDLAETAKSFRRLADNLDKRTAELTSGFSKATASGIREIEQLTVDSRRTLNELNRTLRDFEKNPQQLIFGSKPNLPQYNGR
jgi:phospholipid/cholesterol/gamma-HCH transport system substrate-binding protein